MESMRELEIGIKFSKILHLIQLIRLVDGQPARHVEFIDKNDDWIDRHIEYYNYALSLNGRS